MIIKSRFNSQISHYLIIAAVLSFVLSLFLLQLFAGLLAILWLFEKWEMKKKAFDVYSVVILLFGIARIISITFSEYPDQSIQSFYKEALFYLSFFSFNFYFKSLENKKLISIVYSFIAGSVIVSLTGIFKFNLSIVERAESFSSGYATFSTYVLTGLCVTLYTYRLRDNIKHFDIYWVGAVVILLTGIITSLGRANIAIAVLVLLSSVVFVKTKIIHNIGIILLTSVLVFISVSNNSIQVTQRVETVTQLSDRDILYKGAAELMYEHPVLGYGTRTFHEIFPFKDQLMDKGIGTWHNDILEIYFEGGLLGLFSFLVMLALIYYRSIKILKIKNIADEQKIITCAAVMSIMVLMLAGFFAGFILSPVLSIVFAFLVSLIAASDLSAIQEW